MSVGAKALEQNLKPRMIKFLEVDGRGDVNPRGIAPDSPDFLL